MRYSTFFEIWCAFHTYRISQFGLATFPELNSHIYLAATMLVREVLDHISNFSCKERKEQSKERVDLLCGICPSTSLILFPLTIKEKILWEGIGQDIATSLFKWYFLSPTWSLYIKLQLFPTPHSLFIMLFIP